jgi:ATP/maltotriose-dependent transcriptional regulator MalT
MAWPSTGHSLRLRRQPDPRYGIAVRRIRFHDRDKIRAEAERRIAMSESVMQRGRTRQEAARDRRLHAVAASAPSGRPVLHPDLIQRTALLEWFEEHRAEPVVAVFAPAGYGKTTLLAQAADADPRPVVWVSLQGGDDDRDVLVRRLATALEQISTQGARVREAQFPALAWSEAVHELGEALASIRRPSVVVIDHIHVLHDRDCLRLVAALLAYVPEGSQLVLAGRAEPELGLARVRAERRLAELGRDELALDAGEAGALLSAAGVELPTSEVAELMRRTEGWAVGLYLLALSHRSTLAGPRMVRSA